MTNSVAMFEPNVLNGTDDTYLGHLLQLSEGKKSNLTGDVEELVKDIRQQFANEVVKLKMPNTHDEDWRFTDLSELQKQKFYSGKQKGLDAFVLDGFNLAEAMNSRLVFVNGFYAPHLSNISALPPGVYLGNLASLEENKKAKLGQYLAKIQPQNEVFSALNSSGITDAFVIWVDKNVELNIPIHLLHLTAKDEQATLVQPRILVVAEANSRLSFIEYYGAVTAGCSDSARQQYYLTNAVTEVHLLENASVNHCRIQRESGDGFHLATSAIAQSRNSSYTINEISLGAKLYRHNLNILQQGEQTETTLNGLTMVQGKQTADTHSHVSLNYPYGTVNQLHKYILDDSGHGIFNGKVDVPKLAQETNASQLNRNLLLSPKARINTKPELQITADNVKCAHGATVSQLEADEIFYLRSRGLNEYDARHLLLDAFAAEIVKKIPYHSLRQRLNQCVSCRTI